MDVRYFVKVVDKYVRDIHISKSPPTGDHWHEVKQPKQIFRLATQAERARLRPCLIRAKIMDDGNVFFYQIRIKRRKHVYNVFA